MAGLNKVFKSNLLDAKNSYLTEKILTTEALWSDSEAPAETPSV
jgi:hypothetical protein